MQDHARLNYSVSASVTLHRMTLHFIGKDPRSPNNGSPTVWADEESDSIIIQGWKLDDRARAEVETDGPVPDHEDVIRIPSRMANFLHDAIRQLSDVQRIR